MNDPTPIPIGTKVRYRSGKRTLQDGTVVGLDEVGTIEAWGPRVCIVLHNAGGWQFAYTDEVVETDLPMTGARERLPDSIFTPTGPRDAHETVRAAIGDVEADRIGLRARGEKPGRPE